MSICYCIKCSCYGVLTNFCQVEFPRVLRSENSEFSSRDWKLFDWDVKDATHTWEVNFPVYLFIIFGTALTETVPL